MSSGHVRTAIAYISLCNLAVLSGYSLSSYKTVWYLTIYRRTEKVLIRLHGSVHRSGHWLFTTDKITFSSVAQKRSWPVHVLTLWGPGRQSSTVQYLDCLICITVKPGQPAHLSLTGSPCTSGIVSRFGVRIWLCVSFLHIVLRCSTLGKDDTLYFAFVFLIVLRKTVGYLMETVKLYFLWKKQTIITLSLG